MIGSHTGLDSAASIPAGSIITSASWDIPTNYSTGLSFHSKKVALNFAIGEMMSSVARHERFNAGRGDTAYPLPERITVDLRWDVQLPGDGGSINFVASRVEYESIAEAREALALLQRFATV